MHAGGQSFEQVDQFNADNDSDHRGRASDLSTCEDVVAASGASFCSALTGATFAESS